VDIYIYLAKAMSVFLLPFDLSVSCLALANGSGFATGGGGYISNLFANDWQMAAARQVVLAGYGQARKAAALFEKYLGHVPVQSLFYDDLVIQHAASQLNFSCDILLKAYASLATHKCCLVSGHCWDNGSSKKFRHVLDKLKQTVYGRLAEDCLSRMHWVNLQAVLKLLPLFELSTWWLKSLGPAGGVERERQKHAFLLTNAALHPSMDLDLAEDLDS
jgi:hypothetical protein